MTTPETTAAVNAGFFLPTGMEVHPEYTLLTRVVLLFIEGKIARPEAFFYRPTGKTARKFHHILLAVTAVNAK